MRTAFCFSSAILLVSLATFSAPASEDGLAAILVEKGVLSEADIAPLAVPAVTGFTPSIRVGGRIQLDVAGYDSDDADFSSGAEFRRARFFVAGRVAPDWFYKFQYEFTATGPDGIEDMYLGYAASGLPLTVRVGQMIEAGSLEDTMSSKYLTFMERALPVLAFSPATRRIGIRADTHGEAWHAAAGLFGDSADDDESADEGLGGSARLCVAPFHDAGRVLHLGISGQVRAPRGDAARFSARPEAHVDDARLIDTGPMTNVNTTATAGLEAACVYGPFSLQSEYVGVYVERDDAESPWLDGFYVAASWFLTGESRPYDATVGEFVRLRPRHPFGSDGIGAWEAALRYSVLDLDDAVRGGREENASAAINWYVNDHTRFAVNFVHASAASETGDVDADIVQARAQIDF